MRGADHQCAVHAGVGLHVACQQPQLADVGNQRQAAAERARSSGAASAAAGIGEQHVALRPRPAVRRATAVSAMQTSTQGQRRSPCRCARAVAGRLRWRALRWLAGEAGREHELAEIVAGCAGALSAASDPRPPRFGPRAVHRQLQPWRPGRVRYGGQAGERLGWQLRGEAGERIEQLLAVGALDKPARRRQMLGIQRKDGQAVRALGVHAVRAVGVRQA